MNRADRPTLDEVLARALRPLSLEEVLRLDNSGAQLLDTREADAFAARHLPECDPHRPLGRFASWAGTVLDPKKPIVLITEPGKEEESAVRLGRIGFDRIAGLPRGRDCGRRKAWASTSCAPRSRS